jgi:hypothetical protein
VLSGLIPCVEVSEMRMASMEAARTYFIAAKLGVNERVRRLRVVVLEEKYEQGEVEVHWRDRGRNEDERRLSVIQPLVPNGNQSNV